jgi:hypothetical protein
LCKGSRVDMKTSEQECSVHQRNSEICVLYSVHGRPPSTRMTHAEVRGRTLVDETRPLGVGNSQS